MNITILGASGRAGSEIAKELARRGHAVTGVARHPGRIPAGERITAVEGDVNRPETLTPALAGAEVVISAVMFADSDPDLLIGAVKDSGVARYLVVGGAGSLEVAPGVRLIDTPEFPEVYKAEAAAGARFLDKLRLERGLNWTFLSPSIVFEGVERRGAFRLGGDQVLFDAGGNSAISFPDYAVAMADEVEAPRHPRARFTVGY
ncbi:NAD(P)-dependent oxidoreductase [Brevundimonas sp.]|uniref:NAD(P)-dependent oxidoreductase n=1 Tax=Brevundimonas sp. TaxID=1871086 RepID=UPI002D457D2C|nr:NAD(P)-dependent oxidoreductase [Brevundimonas sp.]HYC96315.1 NAD(P)-dependent oxidoreductase [Brevundimonas sp.]